LPVSLWVAIGWQGLAVAQAPKADPAMLEARKRAAASRAIFDKAARAKPLRLMLRVQPAARMEASWSEDFTVPGYQADHWVLYAAKPVNLPGQRNVSATMNPAPVEITDLGPFKRKLFAARFSPATKAQRSAVSVRLKYKADLMSRHLAPVAKPPPVAPLTPLERDEALTPTRKLDFASPEFQHWLDAAKLRPADNESELDFAARVFKWIRVNCSYEYKPDMDRRASRVCASLKSDCDGLSAIFCCVLRANDIPAHMLTGRWAKSSRPGQHEDQMEYFQEHVKAEFFAQGVGWVPADVTRRIAFDHSLKPPFWGSYLDSFGQDDGDFFVLHTDGPFTVEPLSAGRQETYLQNVAYWATGQGTFDDKVTNRKWEVRLEPITTPASGPAPATTRPAGHEPK
jgi:transglutaminase-like putative cysteine protease